MAPDPRVQRAFRAMKDIGIDEKKVKPVLKKLLKVYERNWEPIEQENYRVLVDAIFDEEEAKVLEHEKSKNAGLCGSSFLEEDFDEEERPLKRRLRSQGIEPSSSPGTCTRMLYEPMLKEPKEEVCELLPSLDSQHAVNENQLALPQSSSPVPASPSHSATNKDNQPVASRTLALPDRSEMVQPSRTLTRIRKRGELNSNSSQIQVGYKGKEESSNVASSEKGHFSVRPSLAFSIRDPAAEPGINVLPKKRVPDTVALIVPKEEPFTDDMLQYDVPSAVTHPVSLMKEDSLIGNVSNGKGDRQECAASEQAYKPVGQAPVSNGKGDRQECAASEQADKPVGQTPVSSTERISSTKLATSVKEFPPSLEIASSSSGEERLINAMPALDILKKSIATDALGAGSSKENSCLLYGIRNGSTDVHSSTNGCAENAHGKEPVVTLDQPPDEIRWFYHAKDITRGQESVEISWVNEFTKDFPPPSFLYMSQSLIFQNARIDISLSRIGEGSCSQCLGNCLLTSGTCACGGQAGKEFAYTSEGVLKEGFLEECISLTRIPRQQCLVYCKKCPLERSKNDEILEPCKGHLKRNFIKECWSKCGCSRLCGNRVVQRGINYKLQVFWTSDGKGWGLRTLEKLPKGAFVCEFVGEILSISEFYGRNIEKRNSLVLLDAYWGLKEVLKDEESLCLDATQYGNVARFINHRCLDANLIEIPVEVETPDRWYYHLAFFTTRDIDALEELTWDYGIEFDDHDHPVKAFKCRCGSKFCRNMRRATSFKPAMIG